MSRKASSPKMEVMVLRSGLISFYEPFHIFSSHSESSGWTRPCGDRVLCKFTSFLSSFVISRALRQSGYNPYDTDGVRDALNVSKTVGMDSSIKGTDEHQQDTLMKK